MTLTHEVTLEDAVESGVRIYLRSRNYALTRWRGAILCAGMFAFFAFLGFHAKENISLGVVCAAAAAWGAGLFLLVYKSTVRRRIQKYMTTEIKGSWPRTRRVAINEGKLIVSETGAGQTFALANLDRVNVDAHYVEFTFGDRGACLIPLRAFASADEKNTFMTAVGAHRPTS